MHATGLNNNDVSTCRDMNFSIALTHDEVFFVSKCTLSNSHMEHKVNTALFETLQNQYYIVCAKPDFSFCLKSYLKSSLFIFRSLYTVEKFEVEMFLRKSFLLKKAGSFILL